MSEREYIRIPEKFGDEEIDVIHTGGEYDSFLQIPVVPPKYQAGDYVYR
jgi:hypothetical protein